MKILYFSLFISFFFQFNFYAQDGWFWQSPYTQPNELHDVCFPDSNNGWTIGNGGVIFRTTDGGTNWNLKNSNTSIDLRDIILSNSGAGNAAMIYNDSIVQGYSAITNTYSALAYNRTLVTLSGYLC